MSLSAGFGSGGLSSVGASGSVSRGDSKLVNEQSGIIGSESVTVNVKGETTLTGAMIANAERDEEGSWVDQGNLVMSTGSLVVEDLEEYSKDKSVGGGFSYSGFDTRSEKEKEQKPDQGYTGGTTTVSAQYGGSEMKGVSRATIGSGSLTVTDGSGETVNRDVTLAQATPKTAN